MTSKLLLIEDDPSLAEALVRVLSNEGYELARESHGDAGLNRATREVFDLVITDLKLPGLSGLDLVRRLHAAKPRLPIILMTAHGTTETAIEATKFGAYEYLVKPFEMPELIDVAARAVANSRLVSEPVDLGEGGLKRDALVGRSRAMQDIYKAIGRVASKPVNVLIRGESGTGKELIARALYQHSGRTDAPFVAINCAAIPESLLESELFGHERGAFTGADVRRIGRFEQAEGGDIFLDEIGDLAPSTQVKLLRVLQERCLQRLGGKETIPVNARVIAATHCDLEKAIAEKRFREDLFYRLSVVVISVPPLRERREDIPDIVRYFLVKHGAELGVAAPAIRPEAMQFLQQQPWPGNVRELENVVRQSLLAARGFAIGIEQVQNAAARVEFRPRGEAALAEIVSGLLSSAERDAVGNAYGRLMEVAEREIFKQAIERAQGNQAKAARWLGITRLTMREKLIQYGLHPNREEL